MVCCSPQNALTTQDRSPRIDSVSPSALQLDQGTIQKYGTPEKGRVEAMREVRTVQTVNTLLALVSTE